MGEQGDDEAGGRLTRRRFLERAGAVVGAAALVEGCSDGGGEAAAGTGGAGNAAGTGAGGVGAGSGAGTNASGMGGGVPVAGASSGTGGAAAAGTGASGAGASGTGASGTGAAGTGASGAGASGTGAAGTGAAGSGAGAGGGDAGGMMGADCGDVTRSGSGTTVAFVRSTGDLDAAVACAVDLAGGLDAIQPGQTVFIKPNAVSDRAIGTYGIRTSNELLASVVRLVKARNPGRIIVGDRSARGFDSTTVFEDSGMGQAALDAGADEVFMAPTPTQDPDAWMLLQPPQYEESWAGQGGLLAMRAIVEADHLINVPQCKNHRYALFSLSMKNFIGAIGDESRDVIHYVNSLAGDFNAMGRDIALLNQMFSPLMNIMDATTALVNGGPQGDGPDAVLVEAGLVLASSDRIAMDAAGLSLIKHHHAMATIGSPDASFTSIRDLPVWEFPQLVHGIERGLGIAGPDEAELAFAGVDESAAIEAIFRG